MAASATANLSPAPGYPAFPPPPEPKLSPLRWGLRGLLILLGLVALYLNSASDPSPDRKTLPAGWSEAETLIVTLDAGETFGQARVVLGQPSADNPPLSNDSELQVKLREIQLTRVLLQAAGSVSQRELLRYQALIRNSLPNGQSAEFAVLLLPRP